MKFWGNQFSQGLQNWTDLRLWSTRNFTSLAQILNRNLTYTDNVFCQIKDVTGITGTNFSISHNLGIVPIGYISVNPTVAASLYVGTTAWTSTTIYLATTAPVDTKLIILGG